MLRWWLLCGLSLVTPALPAQEPESKAFGVREVQVALESLPQAERPPQRFALLIGVAKYQDERIPALPHCENDVRGLEKLLTDPLRGMFPADHLTVLLDEQVTRAKVVEALDELGKQAGPDDLVLVYFTGHGATDARGRSYWVMHGTKVDSLRATGLEEVEVTDLLADIKTSRLVTLIDACFSAATAKLPDDSKSLLQIDKLYPQFQGKGRVLITSSSGEELSVVINDKQHPGFGYSAFSWHVQEALQGTGDKDRDGVITVTELWEHVEKTVPVTARKMGGDHAPQLKGQLGSRFLLAVDATRLTSNLKEAEEQRKLLADRLQQLRQLALDEELTVTQFGEGRRLLETPLEKLTEPDQLARAEYLKLLEGKLAPEKLQRALDLVRKRQVSAESLGIQLVEIKPGEFWMGSSQEDIKKALKVWPDSEPSYYVEEQPRHKVRITKAFSLSAHEITVGQFRRFVEEMDYRTDAENDGTGGWGWDAALNDFKQDKQYTWRNPGFEQTDDHPVVNVSWNDAMAFCRWLSKKDGRIFTLPTEAQWEYACRAGTTTFFNGGDDENSLAKVGNVADATLKAAVPDFSSPTITARDRYVFTAPVGRLESNKWGLHDMHGNVREWCADGYGERYYQNSPLDDPPGPLGTAFREIRGGSWTLIGWICRSAARDRSFPNDRINDLGFRVAVQSR